MSLLDFSPRIPLGTFSILLLKYIYKNNVCYCIYAHNKIVIIYFTSLFSCTANTKYCQEMYIDGEHKSNFVNCYLYTVKEPLLYVNRK